MLPHNPLLDLKGGPQRRGKKGKMKGGAKEEKGGREESCAAPETSLAAPMTLFVKMADTFT